ncbi:hypothetical protein [Streptomyces fulvorobeus]|uniref:Uncharacterized protein n=1 Tax=Streptomyces fulvorobeus TaxID=284028 RepID=A0A7J0C1T5_9ACTN|nr:hypothetical protein [Streptomyces fulvorobeus]NYE40194.1 hypothetical protein [Streptomyces fulvorobeus]GFM96462.1 hypothetical protein Sfulv_12730 [Streptomyces fulvorobeus]
MSVTVPDHHRRRRLGGAAGAVLLALTVSGCSGMGRTAVGPVTYTTERHAEISLDSPSVRGCHRLPPGAHEVHNGTLVDVVLHRSRDCTGRDTTYLATRLTDFTAPRTEPWRSFTVVH